MTKQFLITLLTGFCLTNLAFSAVIDGLSGKAKLKKADGTFQEITNKDLPFELANVIQVETGSSDRARILFSDGTELSLGPATEFRLNPADQKTKTPGFFELALGRARALVKKRANGNKAFEIRSRDAVMGVRGTEFIAEVTRDRTSLCTFNGTVEVQSVQNPALKRTVKANQGVVASSSGQVTPPVTMDRGQMEWWRQETQVDSTGSMRSTLDTLANDWNWSGPTAVDSLDPMALHSQYQKFSLGGSVWMRSIYSDDILERNRQFTRGNVSGTARLLLDGTIVPNRYLLAYADIIALAKFGHRNPDPAPFVFHQGFVMARSFNGHSIAVGRQEWNFGDGLIVGRDPWSPVTRTFDGALATLRFSPVRIRAFGASLGDRVDSTQLEDFMLGTYADFSAVPLDLYAIMTKRRGSRLYAPSNISTTNGTIGQRLELAPWWAFFINEEAAYQFGHVSVGNEPKDLSAHLVYLDAGLAWKGELAGSVRAVYLRASGDSNNRDGEHTGFVPMFTDSHRFLGLINAFPEMRNIERIGASVNFRLASSGKPLTLQLDYSRFQRVVESEVASTIVNTDERELGDEIDLQLGYEPHPKVFLQLGGGYLKPGAALNTSRHGTFAFVMTQFKF